MKRKLVSLKEKKENHRKCQRIINDNLLTPTKEKVCGRKVIPPNRFLCPECMRVAESEEQSLGYSREKYEKSGL